ncbi:U32 family peptidase [Verrucomicrobium spinosum]|uniref:U32 family peptidase n=1 Tax=Verrucomicrobium spinosum TaxID=2736 RepID=UPI00094680A2|nr:U32 family peptidase [Verrucomicrobium spinosum]
MIRNLGAIGFFAGTGLRTTGDFSLNVANPLTAEFLKTTGLEQLTVSYDLNIEQVLDLLYGCPPTWFELTLHQHMPMFHMEHCVFASFMSTGSTFLDCGRPCERHKVKLRDRTGMEHPLKADVAAATPSSTPCPRPGPAFMRCSTEPASAPSASSSSRNPAPKPPRPSPSTRTSCPTAATAKPSGGI